MRLTTLHQCFKFDVIRFTGYWVIAEKPRVSQLGRFFSVHPVGKNYAVDWKMNDPFFDGHDELYHHAKFGEDRTTRAGCRCENMVCMFFVYNFVILSRYEAGVLFVRGWHNLNRGCVTVYCSMLMMLTMFFSALIALSNAICSAYFCC